MPRREQIPSFRQHCILCGSPNQPDQNCSMILTNLIEKKLAHQFQGQLAHVTHELPFTAPQDLA